MSSDEDFSLVVETPQDSPGSLGEVQALIVHYKRKYDELLEEQHNMAGLIHDSQETTLKIRQSCSKLSQNLKEQQQVYKEQIEAEMAKLNLMRQEESELLRSIQEMEAALTQEDAKIQHLRQQTDVLSVVPEKTVVFTGETQGSAGGRGFEMTSRILYPMDGGTALITFEEEEVAQNILKMKLHQVKLGDECHITVEARPIQLTLPRRVEIHAEICPNRVLISNLPLMDTDTLLNKLELHFHKKKNGGGEVETCEFLPESGMAVIAFQDSSITKGLTDREFHSVSLQNKLHKVRVTPFLNGKITNLQTKMSVCSRTVLLTGIPPVEQEYLSDQLEIHFQRGSNGGGEVEAFLYNPLDQSATAVFESVPPQNKD